MLLNNEVSIEDKNEYSMSLDCPICREGSIYRRVDESIPSTSLVKFNNISFICCKCHAKFSGLSINISGQVTIKLERM